MTRALSGQATKRLKEFLAEPAVRYGLEHFNNPSPYPLILDWANDLDHGSLPPQSAKAFAHWLNGCWDDWTEDPEATVEAVLDGAVTDWCGGREMPS